MTQFTSLPFEVQIAIVMCIAIAALFVRTKLHQPAGVSVRRATPEPTTERRDPPAPDALGVCVACQSDVGRMHAPDLTETRSLLDPEWIDRFWRRLGLRREIKYVVSEGSSFGPRCLCKTCYRVARSECERFLSEIDLRRASAACDEAAQVADFLAYGLFDKLRAKSDTRRERATSVTASAVQMQEPMLTTDVSSTHGLPMGGE